MAFTFIPLFAPSQLTNAAASIYPVPASPASTFLTSAVVKLANTTNAAVTATLYAVPAAGTPVDGNTFFPTVSIPANSYIDVTVPQIAAGGSLQAKAGANSSITISCISGALYS